MRVQRWQQAGFFVGALAVLWCGGTATRVSERIGIFALMGLLWGASAVMTYIEELDRRYECCRKKLTDAGISEL